MHFEERGETKLRRSWTLPPFYETIKYPIKYRGRIVTTVLQDADPECYSTVQTRWPGWCYNGVGYCGFNKLSNLMKRRCTGRHSHLVVQTR